VLDRAADLPSPSEGLVRDVTVRPIKEPPTDGGSKICEVFPYPPPVPCRSDTFSTVVMCYRMLQNLCSDNYVGAASTV